MARSTILKCCSATAHLVEPACSVPTRPLRLAAQARSRAMEGTVTLLAVEQQTQRSSVLRGAHRSSMPRTAEQVTA